jgi:hypothetical protein
MRHEGFNSSGRDHLGTVKQASNDTWIRRSSGLEKRGEEEEGEVEEEKRSTGKKKREEQRNNKWSWTTGRGV